MSGDHAKDAKRFKDPVLIRGVDIFYSLTADQQKQLWEKLKAEGVIPRSANFYRAISAVVSDGDLAGGSFFSSLWNSVVKPVGKMVLNRAIDKGVDAGIKKLTGGSVEVGRDLMLPTPVASAEVPAVGGAKKQKKTRGKRADDPAGTQYVRNPQSGRMVTVGSSAHKKLVKQGVLPPFAGPSGLDGLKKGGALYVAGQQ